MTEVDTIIVGQGLAGTCLAWELVALGGRVYIIDREAAVTSSRIAAGLITSVTGQRLVKTWRFEELREAAWEFYRRIESELDYSLLRETAMVKVFASEQERAYFDKRQRDPDYAGLLREVAEWPAGVAAPLGGCELLQGGQIDVSTFMSLSRARWLHEERYQAADLTWPDDLQLTSSGVELPRIGLRASTLIFCEGISARSNPWFPNVTFNAARGEMLTIEIPGWTERRIFHGGVWIAPLGTSESSKCLYRVGATYDWHHLDSGPTPAGRSSLIAALEKLLLLPYSIVDHQSAVRPILQQLNPVIGRHPQHPQLGYFNGLASKGSLQAPFFARQLAAHLRHDTAIEREVDLQVRRPLAEGGDMIPVTQQAHDLLKSAVRGHLAIDATAGNGYDTEFLAQLVGPLGRVWAFDIQSEALVTTANRLRGRMIPVELRLKAAQGVLPVHHDSANRGGPQVACIEASHAEMNNHLPADCRGQIAVIMFNLGYLPGADKSCITLAESTLAALHASLEWLAVGGMLTVVAYPGHPGGGTESEAVHEWFNDRSAEDGYEVLSEIAPSRHRGPRLFALRRVA